MLGLGEGKDEAPLGAKDKIAAAKRLREQGYFDTRSVGGPPGYPSQTAAVALVYVLATALAMLLTDAKVNPLEGLPHTGWRLFDSLALGKDIPAVTGDSAHDRLVAILARGFVFFLAAGIIPALAALAEKLVLYKRVKPLIICWGLIAAVPLVVYLVKGLL